LKDEWANIASLTPNCTDLNTQGVLLVDAALKGAENSYSLRRFN